MKPPKKFKVPANETFRQKQSRFTLMASYLVIWVSENLPGYELTDGDAWRNPKVFGKVGVKKGYGRATSLHKSRLARDYNLFIDGKFQQTTEAHEPIGKAWESMSSDASWGGRFNDGNHYSLRHGKRR